MSDFDIQQFLKERREALLSLDRKKITAFAKKWNPEIDHDSLPPEGFWRGVHKARTACTDLPENERQKSREWLKKRGSEAFG